MRVTKAEEYGVRLVMALAANGGQLTVRDLANDEDLPQPTVAKVVNRLRRGGIVDSVRGRNGGYRLAVATDRLTLAEVVDALEIDASDNHFCSRMTPDGHVCAHTGDCHLRPVWRGLSSVIRDFLARITVADLVRGDFALDSAPLEELLPIFHEVNLPAPAEGRA